MREDELKVAIKTLISEIRKLKAIDSEFRDFKEKVSGRLDKLENELKKKEAKSIFRKNKDCSKDLARVLSKLADIEKELNKMKLLRKRNNEKIEKEINLQRSFIRELKSRVDLFEKQIKKYSKNFEDFKKLKAELISIRDTLKSKTKIDEIQTRLQEKFNEKVKELNAVVENLEKENALLKETITSLDEKVESRMKDLDEGLAKIKAHSDNVDVVLNQKLAEFEKVLPSFAEKSDVLSLKKEVGDLVKISSLLSEKLSMHDKRIGNVENTIEELNIKVKNVSKMLEELEKVL